MLDFPLCTVYYLHSEILFVGMVDFFFALLNKIMSNPNFTKHLLLKSRVPIHKLNGVVELRRIKDLGLRRAVELAMISDKVSSNELGRILHARGDGTENAKRGWRAKRN